MGAIYDGPFAQQANTDGHEGYAAQILADGTTSEHYLPEGEFEHYQGACSCGWRSPTTHPGTEQGESFALVDWYAMHLQPLVDEVASHYSLRADELLAWIGLTGGYGLSEPDERRLGIETTLDSLSEFLESHATRDQR